MTCDEEMALETLNRSIDQFLCDIEGVISKYPERSATRQALIYAKKHALHAQKLTYKSLTGEYEND